MKKEFIVYGLWFVVLISLFSHIPYTIYHIPTALAVESTSSSSPSAEEKTKLQVLQEEIASRAANLKTEINKKLFNKAYVGLLNNKTSSTLTVAVKNLPKTVKINQDTVFIVKNKISSQENALSIIKTGSFLASLGDVDDNGVLTAKKIILLPDDNSSPKKVVYGNLTSLQNGVINLKNIQNEEFNISVDKNTDIFLGKEKGSFSDMKINRQIIAVIIPGKDSQTDTSTKSGEKTKPISYNADYVYILPTTLNIKPKIATPTAIISSPSGAKKKN